MCAVSCINYLCIYMLAQKMIRIMQKEEEQRRLAKLGRERALARFTQKQVADQTVEVYRSLFSSSVTSKQ